jgi:hypothetical protein
MSLSLLSSLSWLSTWLLPIESALKRLQWSFEAHTGQEYMTSNISMLDIAIDSTMYTCIRHLRRGMMTSRVGSGNVAFDCPTEIPSLDFPSSILRIEIKHGVSQQKYDEVT